MSSLSTQVWGTFSKGRSKQTGGVSSRISRVGRWSLIWIDLFWAPACRTSVSLSFYTSRSLFIWRALATAEKQKFDRLAIRCSMSISLISACSHFSSFLVNSEISSELTCLGCTYDWNCVSFKTLFIFILEYELWFCEWFSNKLLVGNFLAVFKSFLCNRS